MKRLVMLCLDLLGSRIRAEAQALARGQARVFAGPTTGEAERFQVPQVWLPDATVARRINRQLLGYVTSYSSAVDKPPVRAGNWPRLRGSAALIKTEKPGGVRATA